MAVGESDWLTVMVSVAFVLGYYARRLAATTLAQRGYLYRPVGLPPSSLSELALQKCHPFSPTTIYFGGNRVFRSQP